jgi:hypothetical protein
LGHLGLLLDEQKKEKKEKEAERFCVTGIINY